MSVETATRPLRRASFLGRTAGVIREMASRPSGLIGLLLVTLHVTLALLAPFFVPYDYKEVSSQLMLKAPSAAHWFGTDHLGRDVFTRTLLGGRDALMVTSIATPIAVIWGGFLGSSSASSAGAWTTL